METPIPNPATSAAPATQSTDLIMLLFSKEPRPLSHWETIATTLTQDTQPFTRLFLHGIPRQRLRDATPAAPAAGRVYELTVTTHFPTPLDKPALHALQHSPSVCTFEAAHGLESVLQTRQQYEAHRSSPGLAVFDMDSTLIEQEVIDELARVVGKHAEVSEVTERAMRGELDFEASLRARVALLEGVPTGVWARLREGVISFAPGARELTRVLKGAGWKTAVLSGGFTPLAGWVKGELGLDFAAANHLEVDEGRGVLTGRLVEGSEVVDAGRKRVLLERLAGEWGVAVERAVAVGDGSNDLKMMGAAGLGIAVRAKERVQAEAPCRVNFGGLRDVAFILGFSGEEVEAAQW